ncbi:serine hydrolase [Aliidiomarina halalkaliphila]|uniref:Beta-lactamase n=1 Tax=Aliidiomarina halalkaliphila TaxID=2593535 RepID=A0A552X026_9GAMM|nr:serine hydrolase [Aliidiomarina halalkaliphila]TRW48285.1 serine hydrolase [Aliidiomarina halalkaliphila]
MKFFAEKFFRYRQWVMAGTAMAAVFCVSAENMDEAVTTRILGDMSGACIAAARIEPDANGVLVASRSFVCADESRAVPDADSRFEIGSVSKTMLGAVLAYMTQQGLVDAETPIAELLPEDVTLPDTDRPIRIRHLLTHTSGIPRLPANLAPADMYDPYADYSAEQLWQAVTSVTLASAPGEQFAYSNFAYMLLSKLVAEHNGKSLEALFQEWLFTPLGMATASFSGETMTPLNSDGSSVKNWNFPTDMEGVGGVRASLRDMEAYVKAHLGEAPGELYAALQLSQTPLESPSGRPLGWGWMTVPVGDTQYIAHGGGTGGFTSMVVFDPESRRGAIVLSNAALHQTGDIQALALHFLEPEVGPGEAYRIAERPETLDLTQYEGSYPLLPGFAVRVFSEEGQLFIQGTNQPAAVVNYVETDTFENRQFGARFVFSRNSDGSVDAMTLYQGGQELRGERTPSAD